MGFFDFLKNYEQYDSQFRDFLVSEMNLNREFAQAFVTSYTKSLGSTLERGRKAIAEANIGAGGHSPSVIAEISGNELHFVVAHVAYYAYINDLRRGHHQGTLVECAIWGILVFENELVSMLNRDFSNFVRSNYKEMCPRIFLAFNDHEIFLCNLPSYKEELQKRKISKEPLLANSIASSSTKEALDLMAKLAEIERGIGIADNVKEESQPSFGAGLIGNTIEKPTIATIKKIQTPESTEQEALKAEIKRFKSLGVTSAVLSSSDQPEGTTLGMAIIDGDKNYCALSRIPDADRIKIQFKKVTVGVLPKWLSDAMLDMEVASKIPYRFLCDLSYDFNVLNDKQSLKKTIKVHIRRLDDGEINPGYWRNMPTSLITANVERGKFPKKMLIYFIEDAPNLGLAHEDLDKIKFGLNNEHYTDTPPRSSGIEIRPDTDSHSAIQPLSKENERTKTDSPNTPSRNVPPEIYQKIIKDLKQRKIQSSNEAHQANESARRAKIENESLASELARVRERSLST